MSLPQLITIATAASLTGQSERTLYRRFADGTLPRVSDGVNGGKTMVHWESIKAQLSIPLAPEDCELVANADQGNAEAQNDLAAIFLSNGKAESAVYWLELAAKQNHSDAMHWLGRCYTDGLGVPKDENLGIMWLSKAAALGHAISQGQMQAMRDKFTATP